MKKLILLASLVALSGCIGKKPAAEETAAAEAAPTAEVAAAAPAAVVTAKPGSYDVTGPDGTKMVATLMADGSYVDRDLKDKVIEKGKWATKDGKTCFDDDTAKAEVCYTDSVPAADGSFTATEADGKVTQVKPHAKM